MPVRTVSGKLTGKVENVLKSAVLVRSEVEGPAPVVT